MIDDTLDLDQRMAEAIAELKALVSAHYPDASFRVSRSDDDPSIVHLATVVDVDDPDDVTDLVIDRMRELLVDEGLPIYVIPIRSPERVAATLAMSGHSASVTAPTSAVS